VPAVLDLNLTSKKGSKLAQVTKISAGLEHSMFLTNDGEVFACGEGEHGQLGLGVCSLIEYRPLKIKFKDLHEIDYITDVACGAFHTLFATKHHSVYATGLNNLG
jgi:alpha-tubulin suppressor-like RCC1 family protein